MVEMPNDQAARQDRLELVELNLVFGEPQKGTSFPSQLPKRNSVVLEVRHKESELGAQRLINLEISVLVRSLKSSNVELG